MKINNKTILIIQVRMSSSRLPGKVLRKIKDVSVLDYLINRIKDIDLIDEYWLATSVNKADDAIVKLFKSRIKIFRGSENDVLSRYYDLATKTKAETIIRITADCPFIDKSIIEKALKFFNEKNVDYLSNVLDRTYPDGLDVEVFSYQTLKKTYEECKDLLLREHVTPYMKTGYYEKFKTGKFKVYNFKSKYDFSHMRWTLDTEEDYTFLTKMASQLRKNFHWMEGVILLTKDFSLLTWNRGISNREGALSNKNIKSKNISYEKYIKSNKFFKKASKIVPLASQTFSKSFQQYSKGVAPLFVDSGKGAVVKDIDGNEYIDYVMGLLPIVLGYCDPDVDNQIIKQINKGITFSLATKLEYELSKKLIRLIPSAEMVRFGKNGSDATSAAIRLARAYTKRDKIAVAGYHGWHDWYIGSTTRDLGVPESVKELTYKFSLNNLNLLKEKLNSKEFSAVILEPALNIKDIENILLELRSITKETGTLLIFDEIISGFRIHIGGAQSKYNVIPDLSTFGKSMANGMPISAIVGRKNIMKYMNKIFFSSTFGGETLSIAASIATIDKLEQKDAIVKMNDAGKTLILGLNKILRKSKLKNMCKFEGPNWWPRFVITEKKIDEILFKSLVRQELNAAGLLINSSLNLSLSHCDQFIINQTFDRFEIAVNKINSYIGKEDLKKYLKGDLIAPTFSVRK